MFTGENGGEYSIDDTPNRKIETDGIIYDVALYYKDSDGNDKMILSYGGKLAGVMEDNGLYMYDDFKAETLKKQEDTNLLGTIEVGKGFEELGLCSGTSYNIHLVGSQEIGFKSETGEALFTSKDTTNIKIGTLTQSFDFNVIPVSPTSDTHYIAVHTPTLTDSSSNTNAEFGTVDISEDKNTLTAIFSVSHFSPFTVYAFTEVEEEIKTIVSENVEKPTNLTWVWITAPVAAVVASAIAGVVIYKKSRLK